MTDDMIERVARALLVADRSAIAPGYYQHMARAAIKAMREPTDHSEIQVSYDLAREDKDLTTASIVRVFENGFKVLCHLHGEDAEAFVDAWNNRTSACAERFSSLKS
jgi:hypothetical protein